MINYKITKYLTVKYDKSKLKTQTIILFIKHKLIFERCDSK